MRRFINRRTLYGVLALVVIALALRQTGVMMNTAGGRCSTSIPPADDVAASLAYGKAFLGWQEDYFDHEGESISARWIDETAIGHLDYLRYNCGVTREQIDNYRFDISLGGYESWKQTAQCEVDGLVVHEFDVVYVGQPYRTRFWLERVSETRLAAFQLSFPASRQADLDRYSARLYPQLNSCEAA